MLDGVQLFSPWLYVVTTLLALYLGFGKRRAEITMIATGSQSGGAQAHRRVLDGYTLPFVDQLITIVSSTTIVAYSLYTFSAPNLPENHTMMLTIPSWCTAFSATSIWFRWSIPAEHRRSCC